MRKRTSTKLLNLSSGYFSIPSGVAVIRSKFYLMEQRRRSEKIDPDRITAELIRRHEFAHYRQLMTTPFGLLVWRAYKTLLSNVSFLASAVADLCPPVKDLTLPIHDWVREGNLKRAYENGATFSATRVSVWRELGETLPYINDLVEDIDVIHTFLYDLLDDTEATVGEFIENANLAYKAMADRSDLKLKAEWETELPLNTPFRCGGFSGTELIEAAARLEERLFLETVHESIEPIKIWEESAIHGVYESAYTWLSSELGDSLASLGVLDAAFMVPIDLSYCLGKDVKLKVEDLLPAFRLKKLVAVAANEFWPTDNSELDTFFGRTLCAKANLVAPVDVAEAGIAAIMTGADSWGYDYRNAGLPLEADLSSLVNYSLEQFTRAMRLRAKNPGCMVRENREDKNFMFRPLITFYDNVVVFGFDDTLKKTDPRLYFLSFRQFASEVILNFLLGSNDADELKRLQGLMVNRALRGQQPDDWFFEIFSILQKNQNITPEDIKKLFDVSKLARRLTAGMFPE